MKVRQVLQVCIAALFLAVLVATTAEAAPTGVVIQSGGKAVIEHLV